MFKTSDVIRNFPTQQLHTHMQMNSNYKTWIFLRYSANCSMNLCQLDLWIETATKD